MSVYGTLEDWRAWATERGDSAPSDAPDVDATAALVRASDYIRYRYVANLRAGYDESLPVVELATYVAASLELATPNFFARTYTPAEQKVLTGVGAIRWTVTGDASKAGSASPVSTLIEAMFAPFVIDRDANHMFAASVGRR